jgi:hypothetical protein
VNSREDADYRLTLAKGYLSRAESDAVDEQWDGCLANAQEAVENAGKSTPPWELIQKPEAMDGLEKARRAVALAESIYAEMTKPPEKGAPTQ